jgi:hypothetical protein
MESGGFICDRNQGRQRVLESACGPQRPIAAKQNLVRYWHFSDMSQCPT